MSNNCHLPELLSPAGNRNKLEAALHFGADAVYLAGPRFGMRASADNFSPDEMKLAVKMAHEMQRKVYITLNVMPREDEFFALEAYLETLSDIF